MCTWLNTKLDGNWIHGSTHGLRHDVCWLQVLQYRISTMVSQGRTVVLVGDLNIAPHMLDHCDWCGKASQSSAQSQFLQHRPDRQWFQSILTTGGGPLSDVFRNFHVDRSAPISFCISFYTYNTKQDSKCLYSLCMLKGSHVHRCCVTGNAVLLQHWYLQVVCLPWRGG